MSDLTMSDLTMSELAIRHQRCGLQEQLTERPLYTVT
jgi:hypothetical protein